MQTYFQTASFSLALLACVLSVVPAAAAIEPPFEIQIFEGQSQLMPPYALISGETYRLRAVSPDKQILAGAWFLSGDLGRLTMGRSVSLTAGFIGKGAVLCRVDGVEQRIAIKVVPATDTIGSQGGQLQSPAGAVLTLPSGSVAREHRIGIAVVAPPGPPPPARQLMQVVQISPSRLVLKQHAQLTLFFRELPVLGAAPHLYFWEAFSKKWVPLQGRVNVEQGEVTASIHHFGIYALIAPAPEIIDRADRLQIQNVTLSPRVFFAPEMHRLTITYHLSAPGTTQVFAAMDIYDLRGRRVRRLFEETPHGIGANLAQWDGLTDAGAQVRNGRYFLVIRARAGGQRAVYRKLIVVFK